MSSTAALPFLGLAPFLRYNIGGADLRPLGQELLARAETDGDNPELLMNIATIMFCLEQRELALALQQEALALSRVYHLPAEKQPARCRLLMLMVPGDLAANTPLDCLLEGSDVDLSYCYLSADIEKSMPWPEHDALIIGINEGPENHALLATLDTLLINWPKPVLNAPRHIAGTARTSACRILQGAPGLVIPTTDAVDRNTLHSWLANQAALSAALPIIIRPAGSHAGNGLARIGSVDELADYLRTVDAENFTIAPFIDYRSADGQFRKYRIALLDGQPYACHMAISSNWMIHYVNAGMYEDAAKREEEAAFMRHFATFAERHQAALQAIAERSGLDYVCIDCAETADGQLLIFEIDHAMVVHAMDPVERFPYKAPTIALLREAFCTLLSQRIARHP